MTYHCAIASPHVLATAAAKKAIARGGNAIDAALAAAVTLTVVYPHNTGLGGDLIALIRSPDGRISCVNASGPAPAGIDVAALRSRSGGQMPVSGPDTITVPGAVAGYAALHASGAALTWPDHFAAAIRHAEGTPVVPGLAAAIAEAGDLIVADPGMRAVFGSLRVGETLRQEALAATLAEIAAQGPEVLYGGRLGERLVAGLQALAVPIALGDLAAYEVERSDPLHRAFRGFDVYTSPPNTQGFLLLQALGALERTDPQGEDSGQLAAIFHRGIADRTRHLADPRFAQVDVDALLLGPSHQAAGPAITGRASGDTVAVVTADSEGHAVSLIQSLFHSFGAGLLEPSTGMVMHNRGAFFSLDAASPNVIAPGKRPAHTLMPVMVTQEERLAWSMGTMGGKAQPQILTQVLLRLLDGEQPADAVAAPRWVVGGMEAGQPEDTISPEMDLSPRTIAALTASGSPIIPLPPASEWVGHAQVVGGATSAGSDPRCDGASAVVSLIPEDPQADMS
ncbi:gamma-glutamyltransferase family protein [Nonomuraea basaltis]|uniref:gamma-glutamyltransferase family protein n=1 Tax=Nonomuraea basaltis TaxID=2495887 RepID=UPI00110C4BCF|nr:gamma-glutamyltransferase [Nonomuraea basaltis]TMR89088.1 gamma-glutamyltranspeptidase [Nonomuraea basaltis]